MITEKVDQLAEIVWGYHHLHHKLEKADFIFVLCSNDLRVADYAAQLFCDGFAPIIVFSGGIAHRRDLLNTGWKKSEAEIFAERAEFLGVPKNQIILETKATNTGENCLFIEKILDKIGLDFESVIVVQKPYMERRAYATIKVYWPNKKIIVTSQPINFKDYPNSVLSKDNVINIMVGDLQRIKIYPDKGFQIFQEIPDTVWKAYQELIRLGYTKHLLE